MKPGLSSFSIFFMTGSVLETTSSFSTYPLNQKMIVFLASEKRQFVHIPHITFCLYCPCFWVHSTCLHTFYLFAYILPVCALFPLHFSFFIGIQHFSLSSSFFHLHIFGRQLIFSRAPFPFGFPFSRRVENCLSQVRIRNNSRFG
jgi:hypothetical protein